MATKLGQQHHLMRVNHCGATTIALKSFTFVKVGPVTTCPPTRSKNPCASFASNAACGSDLTSRARCSVSGAMIAPATSAPPSTPSVSQASPHMPGAWFSAIANANAYSAFGPPTPLPRRVTVSSPPDSSTTGLSPAESFACSARARSACCRAT